MSAKSVVALIFMILSVIFFVVAGFNLADVDAEDVDLVALGLGLFVSGFILEHFVP